MRRRADHPNHTGGRALETPDIAECLHSALKRSESGIRSDVNAMYVERSDTASKTAHLCSASSARRVGIAQRDGGDQQFAMEGWRDREVLRCGRATAFTLRSIKESYSSCVTADRQ